MTTRTGSTRLKPQDYAETIRSLYGLQTFGMKFGLHGIQRLLDRLENPHRVFPTVHIAGTNGKGSTAAMVAAILTAAGYRTGLYTSPHLVRFEERMRINGRPITQRSLLRLAQRALPHVYDGQATFFEAATAIAFSWFAEEEVDIAVIETGLGGKLDATNIITPQVSVITTVDLEHTHILGDSVRTIAREKAGIIKSRVPCVSGVGAGPALDVITKKCRTEHARLHHAGSVRIDVHESNWRGHTADISFGDQRLRGIHIGLAGEFQLQNASVALKTIEVLSQAKHWRIPNTAVRRGLAEVCTLSGIRGRLGVLCRRPLTIVDVAHNPAAMRSLRWGLEQLSGEPVLLVIGVMKDKDLRSMVHEIGPVAGYAYAVQPKTERSRPAADVARAFLRAGVPCENAGSIANGVKRALRHPGGHPVVITGSHFVAGEAVAMLTGKQYLTINQ